MFKGLLLLGASVSASVTLLLSAVSTSGVEKPVPYPLSLDNYHEECQVEGCDSEELSELDEDYQEECFSETCSETEVSDIAGGGAYIDDMLEAFLNAGYVVLSANFNSQTGPTGAQVWLYTGCNNTGKVTEITGNVTSLPNGFNDNVLAFQLGSGITNMTAYQEESYAGTSQVFPASVQCLTTSYPAFANNIESAQLAVVPAAAKLESAPVPSGTTAAPEPGTGTTAETPKQP